MYAIHYKTSLGGVSTAQSSSKSLLEDFIQTTTIPGICQLAANKGKLNKALWVILFVTGIVMAMYTVIEKSFREIEWSSEFPSATVCINTPIIWKNYSTEPGRSLYQVVTDKLRNLVITNKSVTETVFEEYTAREALIFEELMTLSPLERMKLGFSWKQFGIVCEWGDLPCDESEMYAFNNLFYGNCITYNPGLNSSSIKYAAKSESLYITVRSDFKDIYPFLLRDKGPVLLLHPPGTAPVLERRLIYNLFPGRWLRLGVSKKLFKRLRAPYVSMCVDGNSLELQQSSLYFSDETPYLYSMEDWVRAGLNEDNSQSINISEVSGFELYTATTMVEKVIEEPKISVRTEYVMFKML
ncbi:hypothetical protein CHUAL_001702 [Chamberlinius hualienensis]